METTAARTYAHLPQDEGASQRASAEACPYDAIFFDMDGTLLPMEIREFLEAYYQLLGVAAARAGFDAEEFIDALNAGMLAMGDHEPDCTNADAFWRTFFSQLHPGGPTDAQRARVERFVEDFYTHDFGQAGAGVVPNPAAAQAIESLKRKGYPLYLCTMPMFPLKGVEWRLNWANVDIALFDRVTTYDNSTAIKPSVAYYRENALLAGAEPPRILMVGNDTSDDLSCLELGMDVYLVTDFMINRNNYDISRVKHGSLADFATWAEALPPCTSTVACGWHERATDLLLGAHDIEVNR